MSYSSFAAFYDSLQSDVMYEQRAGYIAKLFKKYDRLPTQLLDVACGTGGFSLQFAKMGMSVTAADPSPEMLSVAQKKASATDLDIMLVCQSARDTKLPYAVDGAVCCLDSINHIIDKRELKASFRAVAAAVKDGGLFIFDVNTPFKHRNILSGNTFVIENDDVYCVWQNSDCEKNGIVGICLDFFGKDADGKYIRTTEEFAERAYTDEEIRGMLEPAGLEVVAVLGDMSFKAPKACDERVIYVTKKR
ncbi:MAG: class I SAM-dependent DNA methyltransferase [Acutalibacteraceae bacterium]